MAQKTLPQNMWKGYAAAQKCLPASPPFQRGRERRTAGMGILAHQIPFWILDFGFWITRVAIQNLKSKI
jgi:hypothetical protein